MEISNDELDLIRFLKRKHLKESLFFLIMGILLLSVSLYLFIDGLVNRNSGIGFTIGCGIFTLFILSIVFIGIKELIYYIKLKMDLKELKYINISGSPIDVKLVKSPKKRSFPAPVIEDVIFIFDKKLKVRYHIMYAYDKQSFDCERIKEDLLNYECNFDYLNHSHYITKYDSGIGKCINKSLKRINLIINKKK